ncbi:hypothetical protein [Desulfovibrio inopinatus]|uniref:hypothetical protein n=1 Tax=Desulfovibrio inopinatus TaxID=102109 RepID=UPI00041FF234|nr:hypothetical protein [Desulfovibrio inopinatus]
MKIRSLSALAILVCVVVLLPTAGICQSKNFAGVWNKFNAEEKKSYIAGVATGVRIVCGDAAMGQTGKLTAETSKKFQQCFSAYFAVPPHELVQNMDAIYKDKNNSSIPLDDVFRISVLKASGKNVNKILKDARSKVK